jgi:hypothetical protein
MQGKFFFNASPSLVINLLRLNMLLRIKVRKYNTQLNEASFLGAE